MKRMCLLLAATLLTVLAAKAQQKQYQVYGVGFYNLENLFDTVHDVGKNDVEYLPNGANKWGTVKYTHKLHNMARALADMGTDVLKGVGCAAIGVSEVENANALTDLVNQPELKERGIRFCHIEGPDRRGVDCALLYNPKLFTVRDVRLVPYVPELEKDSLYVTRGFLTVSGTLGGDHVAIIVCHWPSRFIGSFYRESAGRQVRAVKDSLLEADPQCKVMVMGDMNDDPQDRSMSRELRARRNLQDVRPRDMYNPWWKILDGGTGTLTYQGRWNLFDQIVMTPNMLNLNDERDFTSLKFWKAQIQRRDYLIQTEGAYKGGPKRTHAGGVWLDGFSDHLPVVVYLMKEKEAVARDMERLREEVAQAAADEDDNGVLQAVQPEADGQEGEDRVWDCVAEEMPSFPGGSSALLLWLSENVRYPEGAQPTNAVPRVVVSFVVETDGSISDARVVRSQGELFDNEALRVISTMPKWEPGKRNGEAVRVRYNVPVMFNQ